MFGSNDTPRPTPPALPDPLPAAPQFATAAGTKNNSPKPGGSVMNFLGGTLLTSGKGVDETNTNTMRKSLLGQ